MREPQSLAWVDAFRRIIHKFDGNAEVALMNRRDRPTDAAKESSSNQGALLPHDAASFCEVGLRHMRASRKLDALICCERALAINPNCSDALHLMGRLSLEDNHLDLALEWFASAIRQSPKAEYLSSLGTALQRQGRRDQALRAFEKAVQLKPDDAGLWTSLGAALEQSKRPSEAVLCFQHALQLNSRHWEAAWRSAVLLQQLGRLDEALVQFDLCDELRPHQAPTLASRSLVLRNLKRFEDYLTCSRQAHAIDPTSAEICNNIGDALMLLGRFVEALAWFDAALELRPSFMQALENKAVALKRMHRFEEALAIYHRIMSVDKANAGAELGLAHVNLLLGNLEAGFRGREARWSVSGLLGSFKDAPEPVWLGEQSIEGKTILIYPDEGLGDTIQYTRYLPMLAARGARVVLVVQDSLYALLSTLPGVSLCLPSSTAALPPFDVRCPVMSLPFAFRTRLDTIPPPIPLAPSLDHVRTWDKRLGRRDKLRVGLAWSGSPLHLNDHNRSIPLQLLTHLLDVDATFVSLQRDPHPDDRATLFERADIVDLTRHLTDFSETAALVSCLDVVTTVDTSIAHLAGTLGCPTWIMLARTPDWRWLMNRDDSPWYPSVRLFRQTSEGDYAGVIDRVRAELARLARERS
jgi:tetratricopeptide (TPR) repeat protein